MQQIKQNKSSVCIDTEQSSTVVSITLLTIIQNSNNQLFTKVDNLT